MTTMLERAARAVIEAEQDQWDLPIAEWDMATLEIHGALSIARAVLMAVRVPSGAVLEAAEFSPDNEWDRDHFAAMIDAILNEPSA